MSKCYDVKMSTERFKLKHEKTIYAYIIYIGNKYIINNLA